MNGERVAQSAVTADRPGWHEARGDIAPDVAPEAFPHIYGPLNLDAVVAAERYDPQRH